MNKTTSTACFIFGIIGITINIVWSLVLANSWTLWENAGVADDILFFQVTACAVFLAMSIFMCYIGIRHVNKKEQS
jgi:hypothetical protein